MFSAKGFAALNAGSKLGPFSFQRRALTADDVLIDIRYCGVCHSDLHQARDEWGGGIFPMVPGHEIVGTVTQVGANVKKFKPGDTVGVGCMVDSCKTCPSCADGLEQYCENGFVGTYNAYEKDGKTPTYGGYSDKIVVHQRFVLQVNPSLDLKGVAPLLCAGITTYSPLRHWNIGPGKKVAIVGLGGLGHMGVKLARAFGAHVTCITTSASKRNDALELGAHDVIVSKNQSEMTLNKNRFDFILDTVSAEHDLNPYIDLLRRDGTLCLVGLPPVPASVPPFPLVMGRKKIAGSLIGGLPETQEMLDFCAKHNIVSNVEVIPIQSINEAYERMLKNDVKYRFVLDMKSI
jgi:uncharacterized zinc-type alcohol dehydrogenase-like protein